MTDPKPAKQYLEDYAAGQLYRSASLRIDKDQITAFAGQFDPQPYHLVFWEWASMSSGGRVR